MKVAAYIRVSTEEQVKEGYSISAQKHRLEAYALSQGWEVVQFYVDEGISAKDLNRPELQRMIKNLEQGVFDCVLVYRLDRLTRSVLDLYQLLNIFERYNVKFKSSTEVYDTTTAMGRMFITIVAALAQWERENLGERVRMGMQEKAREGKWVASIAPFGYDRKEDDLIINESEAAIVRKIYDMYLTGKYGVSKLALLLNDQGLKTKSGSTWNHNSVKYVLTNPIYIGTMRYNYRVNKEQYFEIDGAVPEIINNADFERVQAILHSRTTAHPRTATSKFIFSGVLRCSRCGAAMSGKYSQSKRGEKVYHSYNYICHNKRFGACNQPLINQNFLEERFVKLIKNWDGSKPADEVAKQQEEKNDTELKEHQLNKEIEEINKRKSKWQYAWVNEMITDEDFKKRMDEENKKEKVLQQELEALTNTHSHYTQNKMDLELFSNLALNWEVLDNNEKKQFVQLGVSKLVVDKVNKDKTPESVSIIDFEVN